VPFTVVVVLHDSALELAALLRSIDAELDERPQVIAVDTGTRDGGAEHALEWGAELHERRDNPGFGAACNAGVERARHDVCVLLNPDCELLDGSLARLAQLARAHPRALHAPRLLNADDSVQRSAHPLPGTLGALGGAVLHAPVLPVALRERLEPYRATQPRTVGWAIAACLAGDTAALRRLGPFDPAAHLFAEDMDLCLRARAAGMPTVLHPSLRVRHAGGHATLREGEPFDLLARRRREVVGATRGPRALALDDAAQALTFASRAAAHALTGGDARRPWRQLRALLRARAAGRDAGPSWRRLRTRAAGHDAVRGETAPAGRGRSTPGESMPPGGHQGARRRPAVLLVAAAGVLGGAERVLLDWARALEGPVLLACPPGPLAAVADNAGIDVLPLRERPLQRRGRSGRAARDLVALGGDIARLCRSRRPAVVVASGQRPLLAAAWTPLAGARLLALQHDLPTSAVSAQLLRAAARRSAALVCTSNLGAQALDASRSQVIHPGVDLATWSLPARPGPPPRALFLGALVPGKRPDLALEIAARVPELRLDVAGAPLPGDPPQLEQALRERAARADLAGRVRFLGAVDDPRAALAEAHCLLHCAEREAFGLALVEALAAGRPVVAPAAAGPLEIVTPACGRLYAPGDPGAGAAAVRELLADPDAGVAARERAAAFDAGDAARAFAAVIERLVSRP
jgi:N-acetylglucosaminyl-diphospho-decaprenol L-rhamnosyltransferase